jgi:hypothetical protein
MSQALDSNKRRGEVEVEAFEGSFGWQWNSL